MAFYKKNSKYFQRKSIKFHYLNNNILDKF